MGLKDYRIATDEEIKNALTISETSRPVCIGGALSHPIPPAPHSSIVRKVLKSQFGPPNVGDPGEKSIWEWILWSPHGLLCIREHKGGWFVGFRAVDKEPSEELKGEANKLLESILKECRKIQIHQRTIRQAKVGGILINPYALYRLSAQDAYDQAVSLIKTTRSMSKDLNSIAYALDKVRIAGSLYRSAYILTILSAEGFVNLLHKLFFRQRFSEDDRERHIANNQLPFKLLELDLYCHSFKSSPFPVRDELFKAIQHLINTRNSIAHANISDAMERHAIRLDNDIVLTEPHVKRNFGLPENLNIINNADVIRAQKLVRKMIIRILNSLKPEVRNPFALVYENIYLSYEWPSVDNITFPLDESDYYALSHVDEILSESTSLDKNYYEKVESEFNGGQFIL